MAQRKVTKETPALAALTNLGPTSAAWLVAAGVKTPARLRAIGAGEAKRAFDAMMTMKKIDIATIEKVRRG